MAVKTLKVDLPAEIFDAQASVPLLHQVVVAQLAAARQGTHKAKNRGEVVHGPTPRNYAQRTPKKMIAAALRGALSDRARHDRVHVVENFISGETPSTKAAKAAFAAITERKNILLVIARAEDVVALSARNLENVHVLYADQLNTYDVLVSDDVVFTKAASLPSFPRRATVSSTKVSTPSRSLPIPTSWKSSRPSRRSLTSRLLPSTPSTVRASVSAPVSVGALARTPSVRL